MTGTRYAAMTAPVARSRVAASSLASAPTTEIRVSGKRRTRQLSPSGPGATRASVGALCRSVCLLQPADELLVHVRHRLEPNAMRDHAVPRSGRLETPGWCHALELDSNVE